MDGFMALAASSAAMLAGLAAIAGDGRESPPPRPSPAELASRLRQDAARTGSAKLSPLFATLIDPVKGADLGLSGAQIDLSRRLNALTAEILRAWILRDLDATPPPGPALLAERLSDRGGSPRARIISHAESIALEGILTADQAHAWRKATGRKAEPWLTDRGRSGPLDIDYRITPASELLAILRGAAGSAGPDTGLWWAIHASRADRRPDPGGIVHLDPRWAKSERARVGLSVDQDDRAGRLAAMTMEIYKAWLTRDLGQEPRPTRAVLSRRVYEMRSVEASLFAHAEAILGRGILTPGQVDGCLLALWRSEGMEALRDPRLGDWLGLAAWQRDAVKFLLGEKDAIPDDPSWGPGPPMDLPTAGPDRTIGDGASSGLALWRREFADALIWDTLKPPQRREFRRILGDEEGSARRPAAGVR